MAGLESFDDDTSFVASNVKGKQRSKGNNKRATKRRKKTVGQKKKRRGNEASNAHNATEAEQHSNEDTQNPIIQELGHESGIENDNALESVPDEIQDEIQQENQNDIGAQVENEEEAGYVFDWDWYHAEDLHLTMTGNKILLSVGVCLLTPLDFHH